MAITEMTRGRYESIAAATRLSTLLPEIGKQVAESVREAEQSIPADRRAACWHFR